MKKMKVEGTIKMDKWHRPIKFKGTLSTAGELRSPVRKRMASKVRPI